jgi:hypothetical protein
VLGGPGAGGPGDGGVETRFVEVLDPADGRTRWRLDAGFLRSRWRCLWGDGCQGIHDERRPELGDGCCSVGVVLADTEEAMTVSALAATLDPARFQFAGEAGAGGVLDGEGRATRVVEGACIFLNRPGFAGGAGCALHLAALAEGDDPLDWKPRTCWKLPLKVVDRPGGGAELAAWGRGDWGPGGATMAWWCIEAPEAFTADRPVLETLEPELRRVLGDDLYDAARAALDPPR